MAAHHFVVRRDPNGNVTSYLYDDFGQLVRQQSPVSGVTLYDYDEGGNPTQIVDANAVRTVRTYDALGRIVSATSGLAQTPGGTFTTGYRYDRDGNRSSIRYPSNRTNVNYTFDHAGRPLTASGAVTDAEYLPFGPLRKVTFANGTTQTLSYDARYRITGNALTSATATLARYGYTHDAAGNITAIADLLDPRYDRTFAYDDLHRLVTANTGAALWRNGSYTWDAMGNPRAIRIGEVPPGGDDGLARTGRPIRTEAEWLPGGRTLTFSYQSTTPRIDRVVTNATAVPGKPVNPGLPVTYDAAGNEVGYVITRTYSPRNLLAEVVRRGDEEGDPFEHKLLYSYDGRGVRVVRGETPSDGVAALARRYFIYTPELKLLSVTKDDEANIWTAAAVEKDMRHEIVWLGDRPVAQIPLTGGRRYTFTDHLGTPIMQTNEEATVVWHAEYEPFGHIYDMRRDAEGEPIGTRSNQPLRFPGQEVAMTWEGQEESYNVFRWYRSGWGRYTQSDPLGLVPTPFGVENAYSYAEANPLDRVDPKGLYSIDKKCADTCGPDNVTSCYGNPQKINCVKNLIEEMKERVFHSSPCRKALEKAGKWKQVAGSLMPSNPYPKITCDPADCTGSQPRYFPASRSIPMCKWFFAYAPPQGGQSMLHEFLHDAGVGDGTPEQTSILTVCFPGFHP